MVSALAVEPTVELLEPAATDPTLAYLVAFGFGLVFFMSAITFGSTIAQSVVEEKQTRVVEILLSTVSARALLTGKVIGNSVMAFAQIVAIAVLAILGLIVTGQRVLLGGLGTSVIWFVVFFAVGFVMLAALFAATAAMVSRAEDMGSVTTPGDDAGDDPVLPHHLLQRRPDGARDHELRAVLGAGRHADARVPRRARSGGSRSCRSRSSSRPRRSRSWIGERIYRNSLLKTGPRVRLGEALQG